jgi:hypothetical protein
MRVLIRRLVFVLLLAAGPALADENARVCFNYGCSAEATVSFPEARLAQFGALLGMAQDEASERELVGLVIGRMHAFAGGQSPISADRGGDIEDEDVDGRMDCLDHSVTTSNFLALLERRGMLRFHQMQAPLQRGIFWQHWSARIIGKASQREYMVDSWFYDNGRPAVVMDRQAWEGGADPRRRRWAFSGR